ncbi:MAG: hypothetical protein U1E39_08565 [Planctomycetota bacterium]
MSPRRRTGLASAALVAVVACFGVRAASAGSPGERAATVLAEKVAPAIVHVRLVISAKASMQGQEFAMPEQEGDVAGVVVDPSGLVLAGSPMHLVRSIEAQMPGLSISMGLHRPRVRLSGDATEHEAVLVAQDASLGLAYFQVVTPPATPLAAVDLGVGTTGAVGDDLYGARRLDREFDDAFAVQRTRVAGFLEQPRRMGILRGDFNEHGMPVFRADGTPAGVYALQMGAVDAMEHGGRPDMLGGLLPLDVVRASLAQAKKRVPDALAKAKEATPEAAAPAKPADGTPAPAKPAPDQPAPETPAPETPKAPVVPGME